MATTVISAFNEFLKDKVNLDKDETSTARNSRDWLVDRIHEFPTNESSFPKLYSTKDIYFGSFARKTKKRELDDIDIMIGLSGDGTTYNEHSDRIELNVPDAATNLKKLCNDNSNVLNSRKVINKFISMLEDIPQYKKAEMKLNKQAAVLNLTSYTWSFDIVPCFFTSEDSYGKTYYIIPDGNGDWMKTDPRIDRDRVTNVNQKHNGNVLNVIRIMKYWNKRPTMPSMQSYLIENMILDYYESISDIASAYVDIEITNVLAYINTHIHLSVNDPKGIQGDINNLSYEERNKIQNRSYNDYYKAIDARNFETDKDYKSSINKWREIFGTDFPEYDED
ncbi:nucleotidyltransferase [Clostridium botulinum]|nr:nucleotidyltransferase [Clostridium botulinum]MBO0525221.1 nucleotidyltransferase [Clostridium botulinum]MBO0527548.1 nucleotidyltransferase [Clostridium botulinum]MBO0531222.1 nucleotidyltransferase [Clostridium botulinum]MBO0535174.1 nucleotidyltransferase [Clostridium botulinum]MBO0537343.1 nucleotidyltransferase [Clostridium botulinum]